MPNFCRDYSAPAPDCNQLPGPLFGATFRAASVTGDRHSSIERVCNVASEGHLPR